MYADILYVICRCFLVGVPKCKVWCFIQRFIRCTGNGCRSAKAVATKRSNLWLQRCEYTFLWIRKNNCELNVRGSVHHSIIHKENSTKCNSVSKCYFVFIWSSTCFGRHTRWQRPATTRPTDLHVCKSRGC